MSFSRGSSEPGVEPGSPALQADSFPSEPLILLQVPLRVKAGLGKQVTAPWSCLQNP